MPNIDLATITAGDGSAGFVLYGELAGDQSGGSVSSAGDVNGDGFDDLIVGAGYADGPLDGRSSAGDSYVVFGKAGGFAATIDLATIAAGDGSRGFVLQGERTDDRSGRSVSSAGDVNGDGFDDLIVGARYADGPLDGRSFAGDSYVIFGKAGGFAATIDLATITAGDGSQGFVLQGELADDRSGYSVSSAGDVNGDGFDDLIVGARRGDGPLDGRYSAGDSYVIFGKAGGFAATIDLATITAGDGSQGFVLQGEQGGDASGRSVSSAGDVNGDGFNDLMVGAFRADGPLDGRSDAGDTYVMFGKAGGFAATIDLATIAAGDGSQGFVLQGEQAGDRSGTSVSSAGDVNGDGFDDLIVGAPNADGPLDGRDNAGDSYVIFGKASGFSATVDLAAIAAGDGSRGFVLQGEDEFDMSGFSVSSAGDVNGDGFDDLIVGAFAAYGHSDAVPFAGDSYVIFGKAGGFAATVDLAAITAGDGSQGFVLHGEQDFDVSGSSVSSAGDVNGDGFDDLIVGAPGAYGPLDGRPTAGDTYVIFGSATIGGSPNKVTHPGTDAVDLLLGDAGANVMIGGRGIDTLFGTTGADVMRGGEGDDALIAGDASFLRIDGGTGVDSLVLSDVMTVTDAHFRRVSHMETLLLLDKAVNVTLGRNAALAFDGLAANDFALTINGTQSLNAAHVINAVDFVHALSVDISANAAAISFAGGSGDDTVSSGSGNDTLGGGGGGDILDGGAGADTMTGGSEGDTYFVRQAGDVVVELAGGGGEDRVGVSLSYALDPGAEIEKFTTTSSLRVANFNLTGNEFSQQILGNAGANVLDGAGGNDSLDGGLGDDTLIGGIGADALQGGSGSDTASYATATARVVASLANPSINTGDAAGDTYKSVENLTGSSFNDALNGTNGTNIVNGVAGNDFIKGYGGNDTLTGGAGKDTFIFNTALDVATNVDTISDFDVADDTVQLDNVVFTALAATGALVPGFFQANATGTAQDSNDFIVYETDTGKLFYDADGNGAGAAVQFALLTGNPVITAADFTVI